MRRNRQSSASNGTTKRARVSKTTDDEMWDDLPLDAVPEGHVYVAIRHGDVAMLRKMLRAGVVCPQDAVDAVVLRGNTDMLKCILDAKVRIRDDACVIAAMNGNTCMLEMLIDHGARVHPKVSEIAIRSNNSEMLQLLADKGACFSQLACELATERCDGTALRVCIAAGAPLGDSLAETCMCGSLRALEMLIAAGARPEEGMTAAVVANNREDMLDVLISEGAPFSGDEMDVAACWGHLTMMKKLRSLGFPWTGNEFEQAKTHTFVLDWLKTVKYPWTGRESSASRERARLYAVSFAKRFRSDSTE